MDTIHLTDTRTYRSCKRKYRYSHLDRIVKIQEPGADNLTIGSAGHKMLDALYSGEEPDYNCAPDEPSKALLQFMIEEYRNDVYPNDSDKWQIASREQTHRIEIDDTEILFTMDLLIHDGDYWIVDHKFLSRFPDDRTLDLDDQITGYIWALRRLGIKVRGLIYNVLLKKMLGPPNVLAKGGVSRAGSTLDGTTLEMYREAIRLTGGTEDAYREQLDYLTNREHPLFRRYIQTRSAKELDNYETYLRSTIAEKNAVKVWYPNPSYTCYMCEFNTICKTENEGGDWRSYIGATHRIKEEGER